MELLTIRRVVLGVLLLGMTGLLIELFLLAHYEDFKQWIPLAVLAAGIGALALELVHRRVWTLAVVRTIMAVLIFIGLLGVYFHFMGSREFQLEMDPTMSTTSLVWHVLRAKSPPTLSPGTLVQMGILGLGYAYLRRTK
jgi:peptidoglycan/LPS O-acetylase OafA/YrhL